MNIIIAVVLLIIVIGSNEYIKYQRAKNEMLSQSSIFEVLYNEKK